MTPLLLSFSKFRVQVAAITTTTPPSPTPTVSLKVASPQSRFLSTPSTVTLESLPTRVVATPHAQLQSTLPISDVQFSLTLVRLKVCSCAPALMLVLLVAVPTPTKVLMRHFP